MHHLYMSKFVTGFVKRRLSHTSDLQTSMIHNFEFVTAIDQQIVYLRTLM